jgi:hypothetical protein
VLRLWGLECVVQKPNRFVCRLHQIDSYQNLLEDWAIQFTSGTATTRALLGVPPARPRPSGLPPPRPWGCAAGHYAACSRATSLACLSFSLVLPSAETERLVLLPRRASRSAAAARAASTAVASTSGLAAASSTITNLVTLVAVAAVSAAAHLRSSTVATSISCWCCALEATER